MMEIVRAHVARLLLGLALVVSQPAAAGSDTDGGIAWQEWTADLFERASREQRFVILDLEAVWCHWCHVMDAETYHNPEVVRLIEARYIPVRVDQDAHPDLSHRYGDWGWPATIVFAPDGNEIVKRRGYIPPVMMLSMLQAIIDDPSPGPSVRQKPEVVAASRGGLTAAQRQKLRFDHEDVYDADYGGWGNLHKFINAESMDYALTGAWRGEKLQELMARQTLRMALNLIDPEWGGVYQYSDQRDWRSPHYEMIMSIQTGYLSHYSRAYALWGRPEHRKAARAVFDYLRTFLLSADGAFYTSQDADLNREIDGKTYYRLHDEARRRLGIPRIDRNRYARENGWVISALADYHEATGDAAALRIAVQAARWVESNRGLEDGGFRHGAEDRAGPYLGDSLAMARAYLGLHRTTGDRAWLSGAEQALRFVDRRFRSSAGGFVTAPVESGARGVFAEPVKLIEENVALARAAILASHYTGDNTFRDMAEHAMRFLASPVIVDNRRFLVGILQVDDELRADPVHITIVGPKDDEQARALYSAALRYPVGYKRIDWWDRTEGPLPNPDVQYPQLERAAAFACANNTCSLPVLDGEKVSAAVDRLYRSDSGAEP
jgi:uncharacterized protein YyaL (SSP411 family)